MSVLTACVMNIVISADVVLSFEFPMYTVLENQMENVCVIVIDGGFQISVSVTVLSQDGSATSTGVCNQ